LSSCSGLLVKNARGASAATISVKSKGMRAGSLPYSLVMRGMSSK
jgi:hypothetical protein